MEAEYFPETSLHFYQSARLYTLESVSMHQIIKEYVSFFFATACILRKHFRQRDLQADWKNEAGFLAGKTVYFSFLPQNQTWIWDPLNVVFNVYQKDFPPRVKR